MSNAKLLFVTHQLSYTGAPIVLLDMIKECHNNGYEIELISLLEGELRQEIEKMGIKVTVQTEFVKHWEQFREYASQFKMVIANTLLAYEIIHVLNKTSTPVMWWIHEGEQYFEYFKTVIPDFNKLDSNIKVYSVGHYVQNIIMKRYGFMTNILHMGVEDKYSIIENNKDNFFESVDSGHKKIRFLTVGTYSKVKAQDLLAGAIEMLPEEYRDKCVFLFCGDESNYDAEIFDSVIKISNEKDNVYHIPVQPHETILNLMREMDALIVSSRFETVSAVAIEAMMMKKVCIISEACGIVYYLKDNINAYICHTESKESLCEKIIKYIDDSLFNKNMIDEISANGRDVYEKVFNMNIFKKNITDILETKESR